MGLPMNSIQYLNVRKAKPPLPLELRLLLAEAVAGSKQGETDAPRGSRLQRREG